ncbi:hypothetical protein CR513_48141, partial [Mucuna pruriens]
MTKNWLRLFEHAQRRLLKTPVKRVNYIVFSLVKGGKRDQEGHWRKLLKLKRISWVSKIFSFEETLTPAPALALVNPPKDSSLFPKPCSTSIQPLSNVIQNSSFELVPLHSLAQLRMIGSTC